MKVKGSYSVEAAILIPLLLMVVLFSMSAAYYLHDSVGALSGAQKMTEQMRIEQWMRTQDAQVEYDGADMLYVSPQVACSKSLASIQAQVDGSYQSLFASWYQSEGLEPYSFLSETDRDHFVDPCKLIRKYRMLKKAKEVLDGGT